MPYPVPLSRRGLLRAVALAGGALAGTGAGLTLDAAPATAATGLPTPTSTPDRAAAPKLSAAPPLGPPNPALAAEVRQEFLTAWNAYRRLAFGRDELRPLSGTGADFFISGVPLGMTIIESLDTLYLMELDSELTAGINWISGNLNFNRNANVHVFESIIRLVGGLLSGHHATGNAVLLSRARDLADRLLPAFNSPTGIPYRFVNLRTGAVSGNQTPLAEVGSNITEFGYLSQQTGDPKYLNASKRALRAVWDRRSDIDLVGTTINVENGNWTDQTARVDPPVDSFFEDLHGAFDMFGDTEAMDWYRTLTDAILARLPETVSGRLWFRQVNMHTGATVGRSQSELTAFYAGLLGQGGNLAEGESYHNSWTAVLGRHKLPPEAVDFNLNALSNSYHLRPEYVDSTLFLWLLTGKEVYRDRGLLLWNRQKAHCKVPNGYAVVDDMRPNPTRKGDLTPGYWFSENMKYFYLLWAGARRFNYADNYLTTEGNVLRGIIRTGPSPTDNVKLVNRASGRLLEVRGSSLADDAPVVIWVDNGSATQQWTVTPSDGGFVTLTNRNSGKVVEVPRSSTVDGTALVQYTGNGTATQQWRFQPVADGFVTLVNRNSGKVAGVTATGDGTAVVQQTANGSTSQQWQLAPV